LVLVTVLAFRSAKHRPYLLVGWLWYVGTLVPVIGLVQVGEQAWADRYTYIPLIGLFVAVVWALGALAEKAMAEQGTKLTWTLCGMMGVGAGLALLAGTSAQLRFWKDTRTL